MLCIDFGNLFAVMHTRTATGETIDGAGIIVATLAEGLVRD